jgi:hypothetical protein
MRRSLAVPACLLAYVLVASAVAPQTPTFFARHDYVGLLSLWVQVADYER